MAVGPDIHEKEIEKRMCVCVDAGFPLSHPTGPGKSLRERKKREREREKKEGAHTTSKRKKENSLSQVQGSAMFDSDE